MTFQQNLLVYSLEFYYMYLFIDFFFLSQDITATWRQWYVISASAPTTVIHHMWYIIYHYISLRAETLGPMARYELGLWRVLQPWVHPRQSFQKGQTDRHNPEDMHLVWLNNNVLEENDWLHSIVREQHFSLLPNLNEYFPCYSQTGNFLRNKVREMSSTKF